MKPLFSVLLLLGTATLFTACGKAESKSLSYDLTENDCKTGSHEAGSEEEYCNDLKNDSLNNGCAFSLRKQTYDQSCSAYGPFTTTS